MSCPDWRELADRRQADASQADSGEGADWRQALHHLDQCPACQTAAPAFEPTLLFRRLPTLEAGHDEVEAMKRAVASMRRGQTIERRHRPVRRSWLRAAALAAVLLGSLMLQGTGLPPNSAKSVIAPAAAANELVRRLPLIETTDPSYSPLYQVDADDLSLVVVSIDPITIEPTTDLL